MNVLVDTSIWSLALRRRPADLGRAERALTGELSELIKEDRILMIGPIRQELLSGIRDRDAFERVRRRLREFDDDPLTIDDFETAARVGNLSRSEGIAGSSVDFLICAVADRRGGAVFTTDTDFSRYARVLSLVLHAPR